MENRSDMSAAGFCRMCGTRLFEDALFCSKCGTKIKFMQDAGAEVSAATVGARSGVMIDTPSKKTIILVSALVAVVLAGLALAASYFLADKPTALDIDSINGCPEFYGVEFDMTVDQASALVEVEHDAASGEKFDDGNGVILLSEDAKYRIHGIPVKDVMCGFDGDRMDCVYIFFSKDDASMSDIAAMYKEIYGEPTGSDEMHCVWYGSKTTVEIYDSALLENDDNEIIVRYFAALNTQFTALSFDGEELDPCGFLTGNYIFDKKPAYYTSGLKMDDDYSFEYYSEDGFAAFFEYILYPEFEYMGIGKGDTAIRFTMEEGESAIGTVSYIFLLDSSNAFDRMDHIKKKLVEKYGQYESCSYTSTVYGELGITDISYDEFKDKIGAGTQGIYHIQWDDNGRNVTLSLEIDPDYESYEGSVAFVK